MADDLNLPTDDSGRAAAVGLMNDLQDALGYVDHKLTDAGLAVSAQLDGELRKVTKKLLRGGVKAMDANGREITTIASTLAASGLSVSSPPTASPQPAAGTPTAEPAATCRFPPDDPRCLPNGNGTHDPCCRVDDLGHIICDPACSSRPCPPGFHRDPNGMCVPDSIDGCRLCFVYQIFRKGRPWSPDDCGIGVGDGSQGVPPGGRIIWGPSTDTAACEAALGACKRHETPPPPPPSTGTCPPPQQCPPGQVWSDVCNQCVVPCQPGYHWEPGIGGAACQCVADHVCPPGQHWDGTGCVPDCPPCDPCPPPTDKCCPEIVIPPCPPCPPPVVNVTCSGSGDGNGHDGNGQQRECCPFAADFNMPGPLLFAAETDEYRDKYYKYLDLPDLSEFNDVSQLVPVVNELFGDWSQGDFTFDGITVNPF